jgi:hypothetical protein
MYLNSRLWEIGNHDAIEAVTCQPPRGFEMIFIDSKTTTQEDKYTINVSSTNAKYIWATSMQFGPVGSNFNWPPNKFWAILRLAPMSDTDIMAYIWQVRVHYTYGRYGYIIHMAGKGTLWHTYGRYGYRIKLFLT